MGGGGTRRDRTADHFKISRRLQPHHGEIGKDAASSWKQAGDIARENGREKKDCKVEWSHRCQGELR